MAMTKKEQAEVAQIKKKLSILAALRWTEEVLPDVPIPAETYSLTKGWMTGCASASYPRVERACSNSVHHSFGNDDRTTTQGARSLHSTKLLALKSLRHEMELYFAEKLAAVDLQIAAEKGLSS